MNWLAILGIGGAVAYMVKALKTDRTASQLDVRVNGINDVVITLWETKFKVLVTFVNPTDNRLTITEVALGLYYGQTRIGSVYLSGTGLTVPEKGQITYAFPVTISNVSSVSGFLSALQNGQQMQLSVRGYAKAGGFSTEINQTVSI